MMERLVQAIEGLYAGFSRYPRKPRIDSCSHCELEDVEARLHRAALRELSGADLGVFAFKAMTTFGDVDDFRHFLPRIAQLLSRGQDVGACSVDTLLGKLEQGSWREWPKPEREAIVALLDALESECFSKHGDRIGVDVRTLWESARLRGADGGFVGRWIAADSREAIEELVEAVVVLAEGAKRGRLEPDDSLPPLFADIHRIRDALERVPEGQLRDGLRDALELLSAKP